MTTKPMTEQEAVEVLKAFARWEIVGEGTPSRDEIIAALAALDGVDIYASRFKPGDEVWRIYRRSKVWYVWEIKLAWDVDMLDIDDQRSFPTREEAEAECQRRNEKGVE